MKRMAEQPAQQQEPVAWVREHKLPLAPEDAFSWVKTFLHKTPLYTSPQPSKPWVELTADEMVGLVKKYRDAPVALVAATETKLREKNA